MESGLDLASETPMHVAWERVGVKKYFLWGVKDSVDDGNAGIGGEKKVLSQEQCPRDRQTHSCRFLETQVYTDA